MAEPQTISAAEQATRSANLVNQRALAANARRQERQEEPAPQSPPPSADPLQQKRSRPSYRARIAQARNLARRALRDNKPEQKEGFDSFSTVGTEWYKQGALGFFARILQIFGASFTDKKVVDNTMRIAHTKIFALTFTLLFFWVPLFVLNMEMIFGSFLKMPFPPLKWAYMPGAFMLDGILGDHWLIALVVLIDFLIIASIIFFIGAIAGATSTVSGSIPGLPI